MHVFHSTLNLARGERYVLMIFGLLCALECEACSSIVWISSSFSVIRTSFVTWMHAAFFLALAAVPLPLNTNTRAISRLAEAAVGLVRPFLQTVGASLLLVANSLCLPNTEVSFFSVLINSAIVLGATGM